MRSIIPKLFLFCLLVFCLPLPVQAQYSQAEINRAVRYLSDRGVLNSLAALTTQDRTKLTSRPDVLMACYEIMKELDSVEERLTAKTNAIDRSLNEIRSSIARGGTSGVGYETMVTRVLSEVEGRFANSEDALRTKQTIESLQAQNTQLEIQLQELRDALNQASPGLTSAAEIRKISRQNRIIDITGVAISAIIAILAAR